MKTKFLIIILIVILVAMYFLMHARIYSEPEPCDIGFQHYHFGYCSSNSFVILAFATHDPTYNHPTPFGLETELPPCTSDREACQNPPICENTIWDCRDTEGIFNGITESSSEKKLNGTDVNYVDFRDVDGGIIEVGCSSGLRASGTGTFGDSFLDSLKCNSIVTLILVLTLLGIIVGIIFIVWRKRK